MTFKESLLKTHINGEKTSCKTCLALRKITPSTFSYLSSKRKVPFVKPPGSAYENQIQSVCFALLIKTEYGIFLSVCLFSLVLYSLVCQNIFDRLSHKTAACMTFSPNQTPFSVKPGSIYSIISACISNTAVCNRTTFRYDIH